MAEHASGSPTRPSLLRRICEPGDNQSWQAFVEVYTPLIFRHARRRGLQDADAAEVTQEVLFQVSRSIQNFEYRPEQARLRVFLKQKTAYEIRTFVRRKAGSPENEAAPDDLLANLASGQQDTQWA